MKLSVHLSRLLIIVLPIIVEIGCAADRNEPSQKDSIQPITSVEQFNSIIENAGDKLLVFNLYADWCMPCHVLAPTLLELAAENKSKITIFKIDTDQFPQITAAFGVTGIPFVVFVKNKKAIYALIGVQPKDSYTKIIEAYTDSTTEPTKPRGRKVEGVQINGSGAQFIDHPLPPFSNEIQLCDIKNTFRYSTLFYSSCLPNKAGSYIGVFSFKILVVKYNHLT
jgi:thioredoxin 1